MVPGNIAGSPPICFLDSFSQKYSKNHGTAGIHAGAKSRAQKPGSLARRQAGTYDAAFLRMAQRFLFPRTRSPRQRHGRHPPERKSPYPGTREEGIYQGHPLFGHEFGLRNRCENLKALCNAISGGFRNQLSAQFIGITRGNGARGGID